MCKICKARSGHAIGGAGHGAAGSINGTGGGGGSADAGSGSSGHGGVNGVGSPQALRGTTDGSNRVAAFGRKTLNGLAFGNAFSSTTGALGSGAPAFFAESGAKVPPVPLLQPRLRLRLIDGAAYKFFTGSMRMDCICCERPPRRPRRARGTSPAANKAARCCARATLASTG